MLRDPIDILGTPLTPVSYQELTDWLQKRCGEPGTCAVDFTNTHIVTQRRQNPAFREATESMDLFIPDGMPLIWCLNARGADLKDRVYGPIFMRRFLEASPAPWTHYFLGGSDLCVSRLRQQMAELQPQLKVVGARHGYFSAEEETAIVEEINRLAPDFVWVGLGTPKQQAWIRRHREKINRGILLAVGFAFDVNAGMKGDAPPWMHRLGLTWLFRLCQEPRRLLGRYLKNNALFCWYCLKSLGRN